MGTKREWKNMKQIERQEKEEEEELRGSQENVFLDEP